MLFQSLSRRIKTLSLALPVSCALMACGDKDGSPVSQSTISGTAAVGLPIVNGTVTLRCKDGVEKVATTNASGSWTTNVSTASLPCAIKVTGGTRGPGGLANTLALYSMTVGSTGNVTANITQLTALTLARAVEATNDENIEEWFNSTTLFTTLDELRHELAEAIAALEAACEAAGYTWPSSEFNPFTTVFTTVTGNTYDDFLEALARAIDNAGITYAQMLESFANEGIIPEHTEPSGGNEALGNNNGATGTLTGTTHTFTANISWIVLNGFGNFFAFKPAGSGFDALTRWEISGIPAIEGTHSCKSTVDIPYVSLAINGTIYSTKPSSGSCTLEITHLTGQEIEGRFTATLVAPNGDTYTITDGYFRKRNN